MCRRCFPPGTQCRRILMTGPKQPPPRCRRSLGPRPPGSRRQLPHSRVLGGGFCSGRRRPGPTTSPAMTPSAQVGLQPLQLLTGRGHAVAGGRRALVFEGAGRCPLQAHPVPVARAADSWPMPGSPPLRTAGVTGTCWRRSSSGISPAGRSVLWLQRLREAGLTHGEVRDIASVVEHPQLRHRQMLARAFLVGDLPLIRFPLGRPGRVPAPARARRAHCGNPLRARLRAAVPGRPRAARDHRDGAAAVMTRPRRQVGRPGS